MGAPARGFVSQPRIWHPSYRLPSCVAGRSGQPFQHFFAAPRSAKRDIHPGISFHNRLGNMGRFGGPLARRRAILKPFGYDNSILLYCAAGCLAISFSAGMAAAGRKGRSGPPCAPVCCGREKNKHACITFEEAPKKERVGRGDLRFGCQQRSKVLAKAGTSVRSSGRCARLAPSHAPSTPCVLGERDDCALGGRDLSLFRPNGII